MAATEPAPGGSAATPTLPLVLASTSRYRHDLLARLRLPFECVAPGVDEVAAAGESPRELAVRLAWLKCEAVAARHPAALVIGSDQVAELDGQALGKPGHAIAAAAQLRASSGRAVRFHTAVSLQQGARRIDLLDRTTVRFRVLDDAEIARYLDAEQPFDCAGSFKVEGLGATLFEAVENQDPTALVGLPLIALAAALRSFGYPLP
jgi:septum formation protein